jgi:hypothetical protein
MFNPSFLSNKNTLSRNTQRIFIHLALYLAANCIAFCTKSHCVLHQIALHFAPNCSISRSKQPTSILKLQFYAILKALPPLYSNLPFAQKERSRESIFSGRVDDW